MDMMIFEHSAIRLKTCLGSNASAEGILLSGDPSKSDTVRQQLNELDLSSYGVLLHDLGNITPAHLDNFVAINRELVEEWRRSSIIIATDKMLGELKTSIVNGTYDRPIIISNKVLIDLPEIVHIGVQVHLSSDGHGTDSAIRLGQLRENMDRAEVNMRHADLLVFDIGALRLSDNLGCQRSRTPGLTIEEMCLLAKYAGAGTNLTSIYIIGLDPNADHWTMMAQNVALIVWYILEGYTIKKMESNQPEAMTSFAMMPTQTDQEIVFKKHLRTGRWWIETYSPHFGKLVQMACSPSDYEQACEDVLSDRVLEVLAKV